MLRSMNEIIGYGLFAKDEDVGKCKDLLFDDQWWTVRHMVADTGNWFVSHQVLVSPVMIKKMNWETRNILLEISREQLENCPAPAADEPVSRAHEKRMFQYLGYPYYWNDTGLWGAAAYPETVDTVARDANETLEEIKENTEGNHIRSFNEVKGYSIKATDGEIGHVEDFIFHDKTWALRYVIVDTRNWLPGGKKVMLSLNWAKSVSWPDSSFEIDLSKEQIEKGPEFDPQEPINVEVESRLYDFYGRPFENTINKNLQKNIANPFL